jgi:tRNA G10  N-methylase Trm11
MSTTLAPHPATFSDKIMDVLYDVVEEFLPDGALILDPFAGTGKIHLIRAHFPGIKTVGIEIEPEWAEYSPFTYVGNSLELRFAARTFDAVMTSCVYGNRMSDHHNAKDDSERNTYTHQLGHPLHPDNAGRLFFGDQYKDFHARAWTEATRVLTDGYGISGREGIFVLNISNFIKTVKGKETEIDVTAWHLDWFLSNGYDLIRDVEVATPRQRKGANGSARVPFEHVLIMRRKARP